MGPPGHLAIAFAVRHTAPKASIWMLLAASEALDIMLYALIAAGVERINSDVWRPWSHGLVMSLLWSTLVGGITFLIFRDHRTSLVMGLLVFSHWILDFISHTPDLPLFFNYTPPVGLGLKRSFVIEVIVEFLMLAVGVAIYWVNRKRIIATA